MPTTVSIARAERHEALILKLAALERQVAAAAVRRPGGPIGEAVRVLAEGLLFEARPFTGHRGLVAVPPTLGGLAVALGQALAALEAFELRHTRWDPVRRCLAWRLGGGATLPVQRHRPTPLAVPGAQLTKAEQDKRTMALARRVLSIEAQALIRARLRRHGT